MSTPPLLIRHHLHAGATPKPVLFISEGRLRQSDPAVAAVIGAFEEDERGGYVAPARAVDGGIGYLNGNGEWLHPPTLAEARNFSPEGRARFSDGEQWGYLDRDFAVAIAPRFDEAQAFVAGRALVSTGGRWHFIGIDGAFAFEHGFERAASFTAVGLAVASEGLSKGIGYIDRAGNWAIAPRFARALDFSAQGVAPVSLDGERYGLIDTEGNWVMEPADLHIRDFNAEGLAYCYGSGSHSGYIDTTGKLVMKGVFRLGKRVANGLVLDGDCFFVSVDGRLVTSTAILWAKDFNTHGFTIARGIVEGGPHRARWGVLDAQGTFIPAPSEVSEPLTNASGMILACEPGTPLAAFATVDGDVVLIGRDGTVAYRLGRVSDGVTETAMLSDAAGLELWRGEPHSELPRLGGFFNADPSHFLIGIDTVDGIVQAAEAMLARTESRLHAFAAGELPDAHDKEDKEDEDEEDEDEEFDRDDDDDDAPTDAVSVAAALTGSSQRVYRDYLDEHIWGTYTFLSDDRGALSRKAEQALIASLTARFGPPDADPDFAGSPPERGTLAWPVALSQPLDTSSDTRPDARRLWIGISSSSDSGDGDIWFHINLHCMPSVETLEAAMTAYDAASDDEVGEEIDEAGEEVDAADEIPLYDRWLAHVVDRPGDIGLVPPELIDDAMADAAVRANRDAFAGLPVAFQTPARLESIIRSGAHHAAWLPVQCMTTQGLALARSLYADEQDWHSRDECCSRMPPVPLDHNSLYEVWGCLVSEQLAFDAVSAGVNLGSVPRWLRSERLEAHALDCNISNLIWLDKERITPELAAHAVRKPYSELIEYVPEPLRTPAVCLASVQAGGKTLRFVPEALRTVALCAAATRGEESAFVDVPAALEEAVCSLLIDEDQASGAAQSSGGTRWHGLRAWSRMWRDDDEGAIADALLSIPCVPYPAHAHFVMACAYDSLGEPLKAAGAAAAVLAIWDNYETEFGGHNETAWLKSLAASAMRAADDATLLAELAVRPASLSQVPHSRVTAQMVEVAIRADPASVRYVPKRLMTGSLYGLAVENGCKLVTQIPSHLWDEALALQVARRSKFDLEFIPQAWRTLAVYRAAVAADSEAIRYVPDEFRAQLA